MNRGRYVFPASLPPYFRTSRLVARAAARATILNSPQGKESAVSQHISRKELKKDQIRESIVHAGEAALSHQKMIWGISALIVVLAVAIGGWRVYSERQSVKAAAALDDAQKIFQARIRTIGEPEQPGEVSYTQEKNKFEDAAKKFEEVANNYARTRQGLIARYYAGLSNEHLAKFDDANKWFREVENGGNAELASLARYRMAQIAEKTNKGEEAVKLYQQLIANPTTMVSKPYAQLALADHYSRTNPAEARKLYDQISAENPETELASAAQQRLAALPPQT